MTTELSRRLFKLGMDQDSWSALLLLPLVEVAWADGELRAPEQRRIAALAGSLELSGEAMLFVRTWLRHCPSEAYFERGRKALYELLLHEAPELARLDTDDVLREAEALVDAGARWPRLFRRVAPERKVVLDRLQGQLQGDVDFDEDGVVAHPDLERAVNPVTIDFDDQMQTDEIVYGGVLIPDFVLRVRYEVPPEGIVIGQGEGCDLRVLDHQLIAQAHCRINGRGNRYYVQEMGGETRVNGERVLERRLLGGETIRLADGCTFAFKRVRKLAPSLV